MTTRRLADILAADVAGYSLLILAHQAGAAADVAGPRWSISPSFELAM